MKELSEPFHLSDGMINQIFGKKLLEYTRQWLLRKMVCQLEFSEDPDAGHKKTEFI